jgi:hypothetical protein
LVRPTENRTLADQLLADAFAHQYRYPAAHCGFSATCRLRDEHGELEGVVAMSGVRDVEAMTDAALGTPRYEWLMQDLRSLARTLWGHDYVANEGRFAKSLDDTPNPLGVLITLHDDPHQATFRVRKHRITVATRTEGSLRHSVRIDRWHLRPDGRWLPAQWTVEVWDHVNVVRLVSERYWDLFWPIAGELVPQLRRVDATDDLGVTAGRSLTLAGWQRSE